MDRFREYCIDSVVRPDIVFQDPKRRFIYHSLVLVYCTSKYFEVLM